MKSSFCIDLQRFMLIPTKFPLNRTWSSLIKSIAIAKLVYNELSTKQISVNIEAPIRG